MVKVIMSSHEFGREEFDYDNWECAEKAMKRLVKKARSLNDGIDRKFEIIEDTGDTVICGVPDFAKRFTKKNEQEKALTFVAENIRQYIADGGTNCIYCLAREDTEAVGPVEVDGITGIQDVECKTCGATWQDVYKLVDVHI